MSARRALVSLLFVTTGLVRAAGPAPAPVPEPSSSRVWVGVFFGDAVDGGVQIIEVVPQGPAAKAGLTSGDLVIRIDGKDVTDRRDLSRALEGHAPGDTVGVTILREGEAKETKVVLGSSPRTPWPPVPPVPPVPVEPTSAADLLGISIQEIPEDLRKALGGPADAGLLVMRVDPEGISSKALKPGDLLTSIGGKPVATEAGLDRAVLNRSSGPVALAGRRSKASFTSEVSLRLKSPEQRAREERARALENTIRQLEGRLVELKRQLAQLSETP
jgi:S1-C subfamily serine protease